MGYQKDTLEKMLKEQVVDSINYQFKNWDNRIKSGCEAQRKLNPGYQHNEMLVDEWKLDMENHKYQLQCFLEIVEEAIKNKKYNEDGEQVITLRQF